MKGVDKRAFETLYYTHWEMLFRYVVNVLKDEDDAADVLQDVFVKLWEQRNQLQHIDSPKAYLFTVARNSALRFIALHQHKQHFIANLAEFLGDDQQTESVEDQVTFAELRDSIDGQIEKLPTRMREVFQLSRTENLSHREIAERLNISENTVKKQVTYALKLIRSRLKIGSIVLFLFLNQL